MKKKFVVALLSALSLTVVGTGTVFATDKTSAIEIEKEHVHGDGCKWIIDKEAWDEIVHHPAEYEDKWIVDKPAWTETIKHPEEGHYEKVEVSPEEGHYEFHYICNGCGQDFGGGDAGYNAVHAHNKEQMLQGNTACGGYHDDQVWVVDKEAVYEDKWVVDKEAWTETIEHPEEGHTEKVLVKEAWDETVHHDAEGHWECEETPENPDQKPEQPEQPENPDQKPEQPEQPENPDQKPEQPENPDVETPEQPEAEAPNNQPEADKEETQTPATETQKEETAPKTGDTASALPVAGAGVASLGVALATILKKRK